MLKLILFSSLIFTSFSFTAVATEISEINSYMVIHHNQIISKMERDQSVPNTDCQAVDAKIKLEMRNIKRCSAGESQPEAYCNLVREDLQRFFNGFKNRTMNQQEPDVQQRFFVKWQASPLSATSKQKILEENSIDADSGVFSTVDALEPTPSGFFESPQSVSFALANAPILDHEPKIKVTKVEDGFIIHSGNRLSTCEILKGQWHFRFDISTTSSYSLVTESFDINKYWNLYRDLRREWSNSQLSITQKSTWMGVTFGRFLQSNHPELVNEKEIWSLAKTFFKFSQNEIQLNRFNSKWTLGKSLPQRKHSQTTTTTLEARYDD